MTLAEYFVRVQELDVFLGKIMMGQNHSQWTLMEMSNIGFIKVHWLTEGHITP